MKRLSCFTLILALTLVLASCGKGGNSGIAENPLTEKPVVNFENDPSGIWEYEYLPSKYYSGKSRLIVSNETLLFNGKKYFKVTLCEHDKSLRAIRIHKDDGSLKIDWVIEKNPADKSGKLGLEQSAILKADGTQLSIADYKNNPFATLTRK